MTFVGLHTGSFSSPAAGNPTGVMMEAAYRHHDLDARYLNCEVSPADLADAVAGARAMRWAGFNCSLPHKVRVIDHLDGLAPSAGAIGAVNCVVITEGRLIGHNTDGQGFVESLRAEVDPAGLRCVVLGAGGAGRAVAVELAMSGAATVTVVNRDLDRGAAVVAAARRAALPQTESDVEGQPVTKVDLMAWQDTFVVPQGTQVLINATSVGYTDPSAMVDLEVQSITSGQIVADVVVSAAPTALLRAAAARGAQTLDGVGMLVNQGALAVQHWTGVDPDRHVMRAAVQSALARTRPS